MQGQFSVKMTTFSSNGTHLSASTYRTEDPPCLKKRSFRYADMPKKNQKTASPMTKTYRIPSEPAQEHIKFKHYPLIIPLPVAKVIWTMLRGQFLVNK